MATTNTTTTTSTESAMLTPDTTLELVIPWSTIQPVYEKMSRKVASRVKLDGFRKGKVPSHLAKQVIGQEQIVEQTLEEVVPPAYIALLEKESKRPLGNPEFHPEAIDVGHDWKLHVHIAEKPDIKLGDWKKIVKKAKDQYKKEKTSIEKESKDGKKSEDPNAEAEKARSDELGIIYGALVTSIRPAIPQLLVKQEATTQLKQLSEQLERFSLTFESFLASRNMTQEQLQTQMAAEALSRLQLAFIIDTLIVELKLQPTAEAVKKEITARDKEIQDYYQKNPNAVAALENRLAQQNIETHLLSL